MYGNSSKTYGKNSFLYGKNICIGNYDFVTPNFIPQLDGNLSPPFSASFSSLVPSTLRQPSPTAGLPVPPSAPPSHPAGIQTRIAPFRLNQQKQLNKLSKNSLLKDFEVTVSPSNQNVTIQCSVGFYTKVAIPALRDISIGHTFLVGTISVHCKDLTGKIDSNSADINAVVHLRFSQNKLSLGGVAIHLHHTVQKVQVQGSAILPDNTCAPIWFVNNVIKDRFSRLSRTMSFDISSFNSAVQEMTSKSLNALNICSGCKIQFSGRSVPEFCHQCSHYFHKFKCFPSKSHHCYMKKRTQSFSVVPGEPFTFSAQNQPNQATDSLPDPGDAALTQASARNSSNHQPSVTPDIQDSLSGASKDLLGSTSTKHVQPDKNNLNVSAQPQVPSPAANHVLQLSQSQDSTLDPTVPPFVSFSQPVNREASKTKRKSKAAPATDKLSIELEYAKYEVNITKAKLRDQENTIKDLKFRNGILEDRIQSLETIQKQQTFEKYFPSATDPNPSSSSSRPPPPPPSASQPTKCCCRSSSAPLCCMAQHCQLSHGPNLSQTAETRFANLTNQVERLVTDLAKIKCDLERISSPATDTKASSKSDLPSAAPSPDKNINPEVEKHLNSSVLTIDDGLDEINSQEDLNC